MSFVSFDRGCWLWETSDDESWHPATRDLAALSIKPAILGIVNLT